MATADELLANELTVEDTWCEIDLQSRKIIIPGTISNLGTKSEANIVHVKFRLPRFYNDIDFADFDIGIDYINAKGEEDRYEPKNITVDDDVVTFTWIVGRHAALYDGAVTFGICAKRPNPDNPADPLNEFHTTKASLPILDSMETCEETVLEYTDLLEQWRAELFGKPSDENHLLRYDEQTLTPEQQAQARDNIGAADRNDVEILLAKTDPCVLTKDSVFYKGYLSGNEFIEASGESTQRTSDFIELEPGVLYQCDYEGVTSNGTVKTYPRTIAFYDADKNITRGASLPSDMSNLQLQEGDVYLRLNYSEPQVNVLRVYPKHLGYEPINTFNPELEIPQVEEVREDIDEIREQIEQIKSIEQLPENLGALLTETDPCVLTQDSVFFQGYLSGNDFIEASGASTQRTSDFIELEPGIVYQCEYEGVTSSGTVKTYPRTIVLYNADKTVSRSVQQSDIAGFYLDGNEKYLRLNYNDPQVNILRVYPKHLGYEPIITLNPELEVPQIKTELKRNEGNYIHARRPIIAFIFDGEYDRNAEMEAKFSQHNMRVGFAPQYNTTFPNNPASTYLAWQKKGHEILAHGQYVLNGDRYTEEQGKQYIQESYERLSKYGFNIHGYIGCEGKVDEKYLPTIKRYYDYAATENNGSGDGTKSTFYFGTHNPYQLWRFSLASSTPDQCMDAVDHAMNTGGLLLFYAHARSTDNNNLTLENLETLLTHIEEVGAIVKTPYEAIKDFFSIRYEDIIAIANPN